MTPIGSKLGLWGRALHVVVIVVVVLGGYLDSLLGIRRARAGNSRKPAAHQEKQARKRDA